MIKVNLTACVSFVLPSDDADGANLRTLSPYFSVFLFESSKFGFGTSGLGAL